MIGDSKKNCRCMLQYLVFLLLEKALESNALCAMGQFMVFFAAAVLMNHCIGRVLVSRDLKPEMMNTVDLPLPVQVSTKKMRRILLHFLAGF